MKLATVALMLLPFLFASVAYLFPYTDKAEMILGLWAACTIACLAWAFLIRRKHRGLAWACVAIAFLQLALMLLPALKKEKSKGAVHGTAHLIGPLAAYNVGLGPTVCRALWRSFPHPPA